MRLILIAAAFAACPPALAEAVTPARSTVLNCHFSQSCISGGCGEETYDATLEVAGAKARLRDAEGSVSLTGGMDPVSGQMSFGSQPADDSSYFISTFGNAGAVMSIHTQSEGKALVIAYEGRCEEVQ